MCFAHWHPARRPHIVRLTSFQQPKEVSKKGSDGATKKAVGEALDSFALLQWLLS
jgi:hypothetical protein